MSEINIEKIALAEKRAIDMPTDSDAFKAMQESVQRLRDLGWKEIIYCPKDGTLFEAFDTGFVPFTCHYSGKWPDGNWWGHDKGYLWPCRPILWRPIQAA